jgi:DNA primase
VDEVLRILQKTGHRIEKEECLRRVAERLGISQQRLIERYPELVAKEERRGSRRGGQQDTSAAMPPSGGRFKGSPEERDLVHLLLLGQLTADQIRALNVEAFSIPVCRRIVEIALRHLDRDGRVLVRPMLDETVADSDCGPVATELSMMERHDEDVQVHVRGCLETLERKRREQALAGLIVQLRAAEQAGRTDEARRLNAQVNDLRMRKAGVPPAPTA